VQDGEGFAGFGEMRGYCVLRSYKVEEKGIGDQGAEKGCLEGEYHIIGWG